MTRLIPPLALLLLLVTLSACGFSGRRLLSVDYEWNGATIASTSYEDDGRQPAPVVWSYLDAPPVVSAPPDADLPLETADALRLTLTGVVTIRAYHVDSPIAGCEIDGLVLVRDSPDTGGWYLPPEEVVRTAAAAGFALPE